MKKADKDIYHEDIEIKPTHIEAVREIEREINGDNGNIIKDSK